MIIELVRLPLTTAGVSSRSLMPARALLLAPDAAKSFLTLERESGGLVYTEIYQSLDATLAALERRRETYQPSFSPHGYGLAFDLDVDATLARTRWTYARLLSFLEEHDWICFRRDRERGDQDHHWTFLGKSASRILGMVDPVNQRTWPRAAGHLLDERFGAAFRMTPVEQQAALAKLGLYHGEVDGNWSSMSRHAKLLFERQFLLEESRYQRVLSFVSAELQIVADYSSVVPAAAA